MTRAGYTAERQASRPARKTIPTTITICKCLLDFVRSAPVADANPQPPRPTLDVNQHEHQDDEDEGKQ